jgi:hypothetical protein
LHQNSKLHKLWCNCTSNRVNDLYGKLSTSKFTNICWPIVTVYKTWLAQFTYVCWGWSSEKSVHIIVMLMKGSEIDKRMDRHVHVEKPKDSAWEYSLSRYNIVRRIPYPFELPSFLRDRLINSWGHEMTAADFGPFQSVKFKLDRCNV